MIIMEQNTILLVHMGVRMVLVKMYLLVKKGMYRPVLGQMVAKADKHAHAVHGALAYPYSIFAMKTATDRMNAVITHAIHANA